LVRKKGKETERTLGQKNAGAQKGLKKAEERELGEGKGV